MDQWLEKAEDPRAEYRNFSITSGNRLMPWLPCELRHVPGLFEMLRNISRRGETNEKEGLNEAPSLKSNSSTYHPEACLPFLPEASSEPILPWVSPLP